MVALAKALGGPGSLGFLALGCAIGLGIIYVWPRRRAAGRWWLFGLYSSYLVLGIPAIAHRVAAPLAFQARETNRTVDALIVFGGDNMVGRVGETVRVWRRHSPGVVVVSGQPWLLERLEAAGIPPDRLLHDPVSSTTREQVDYVKAYMTKHPVERVAVICSRLQARRVAALMRAAALNVAVVPSPVDREPPTAGIGLLIPTYAGLRVTRDAFYERVALAYYERNGWIRDADRRAAGADGW